MTPYELEKLFKDEEEPLMNKWYKLWKKKRPDEARGLAKEMLDDKN